LINEGVFFWYYVKDYTKLRFIIYKTDESGNTDVFDRYNDFIFTSNPFDDVSATSFKNVKMITEVSSDDITYNLVNTYTIEMKYSSQQRLYGIFGDVATYNPIKYVAITIDLSEATNQSGVPLSDNLDAKMNLSTMYITTSRQDRALMGNYLPGLSGKIENGKQTIIVKNLEVENELKSKNSSSCWARVDIDGTLLGGYNVGSITKVSTGVYQITFSTPMANANYCAIATCNCENDIITAHAYNLTTDSIYVKLVDSNNQAIDAPFSLIINGGL